MDPSQSKTDLLNSSDEGIFNEMSGRWRVLDHLGSGGMSNVYRATDLIMNRDVAIKMMLPHLLSHEKSVLRFQHEAKTAGTLNHPNLVQIYECATSSTNRLYIVMEYLHGKSLAQVIREEGALSPLRAVAIFTQICEGLQHAHEHNIIHRDLKPSNVMVAQDKNGFDTVKLVDFGIAKLYGDDTGTHQALTATGEMLGSPLYMSPEQCSGNAVDLRTDIYSLGCLMYETMTGLPPLVGVNAMDTMQRHISEKPKPVLANLEKTILAQRLEPVIMRCLAKSPDERYSSVSEVLADLELAARKAGKGLTGQELIRKIVPKISFKEFRAAAIAIGLCALSAVAYFVASREEFREHSRQFSQALWTFEPIKLVEKTGTQRNANHLERGDHENNIEGLEVTETEVRRGRVAIAEDSFDRGQYSEAAGQIEKIFKGADRSEIPLTDLRDLDSMQAQCSYIKNDFSQAGAAALRVVEDTKALALGDLDRNEKVTDRGVFAGAHAFEALDSFLILENLHQRDKQYDLARQDCDRLELLACGEMAFTEDLPRNLFRPRPILKRGPSTYYVYPWYSDRWSRHSDETPKYRAAQGDMLRLSIQPHKSLESSSLRGSDRQNLSKDEIAARADAAMRHLQLAYAYQLAAAEVLPVERNLKLVQLKDDVGPPLFSQYIYPKLLNWDDVMLHSSEVQKPSQLETMARILFAAGMTYELTENYAESTKCLKRAADLLARIEPASDESIAMAREVRKERMWLSAHCWDIPTVLHFMFEKQSS